MNRFTKILLASALVSTLSACAIYPAPHPHYGARVEVMTVRGAPVYREGHHHHHHHGHGRHHFERHGRW